MLQTLTDATKRVAKLASENSPAILTSIGVVGTVTTALLTAKSTIEAYDAVMEENHQRNVVDHPLLEAKDVVKLTWKFYIPPVMTCGLTVGCILGANHVSTRRNAALISAYSISEKAFTEYREKVAEKFGENKATQVRDEIVQDRVTNNPPSREIVINDDSEVLCMDTFSGRYFKSTHELIRKAENNINRQINQDMYASLNDFYDELGLPRTSSGEEIGWNVDAHLEVVISAAVSTDNKPCLGVGYTIHPRADYYKVF